MKREWKIEYMPTAHAAGWPGAEEPYDWREVGGWWGLWLFEDGVPVRLLGEDGDDPSLARDWSWVRDACAEAYAMGLADAAKATWIEADEGSARCYECDRQAWCVTCDGDAYRGGASE